MNSCRPWVGLTSPCQCGSWLVWLTLSKHQHVSPNCLEPWGWAQKDKHHFLHVTRNPPGCSFTSSRCVMPLRVVSLSSCHHLTGDEDWAYPRLALNKWVPEQHVDMAKGLQQGIHLGLISTCHPFPHKKMGNFLTVVNYSYVSAASVQM